MEKIANALGVTLGQFFLSANQQVVNIVRASDRRHMALDWSRAEIASLGSLSNAVAVSRIHAHHQTWRPHRKTCHPSISDEFAMVFEGTVILKLPGQRADPRTRRFCNGSRGNGPPMAKRIRRSGRDPGHFSGALPLITRTAVKILIELQRRGSEDDSVFMLYSICRGPLQRFELLPCLSQLSFRSQPLIVGKVFGGFSDGWVKVRCGRRALVAADAGGAAR